LVSASRRRESGGAAFAAQGLRHGELEVEQAVVAADPPWRPPAAVILVEYSRRR
jgi:hypothetical protein